MQRETEKKWEKGARREGADSATHSRARIATLAVVQTVYPTIKSDARLCRGNPLASARFKRGGTSNAWAEASTGVRNKQKARRPVPIVGAFRSLAHCIFPPSHLRVAFLSCFSLYTKLSLLQTRWLSSLILPFPPQTVRLTSGPKEEMCLCLDSRQIICGNKFLCV